MSAGKGDKPRNCFSSTYKKNYDDIDWRINCKNCNSKYLSKYKICPSCGFKK